MAGVTSNYPASIDSESNIIPPNNGDTLTVPGHWLAGNNGPIVNVQNELGTDPSGSFSTVKARLDDIDDKTITEIDQWQITSSHSAAAGTFTTDWDRSAFLFTKKGTGLSQSSGRFSFPSTGYYYISYSSYVVGSSGSAQYVGLVMRGTTDNFSSVNKGVVLGYNNSYTIGAYAHVTLSTTIRISDIVNQKVEFGYESQSTATWNGSLVGDGRRTGFLCMKVGEL